MSREVKIARIDELAKLLNEASRAYYDEAAEIMTNYEYDALYDELLALEDETGYVRDDSPSINVGYEVTTALPKVTHPTKMLSLNKTKDRDELRAWLSSGAGGNISQLEIADSPVQGLLSWKLDGLTVVLTYENGRLSQAVTRGNGTQGELVTPNILACKNVPKIIPCKGKVTLRGEAVIKYSDFARINDAIDDADAKYKNPRNLCSGSLRQLDPAVTAARSVNFYAFSMATQGEASSAAQDGTTDASILPHFSTRQEQMEWLRVQGFEVVEYVMVDEKNLFDTIDTYEGRIPGFDIPSDGLVLTLNDIAYASTLGATAKYPRDAIAFKWRDQQAETILREIEWSPSRTGLLNPVAIFDSVELEGTSVSRASVHNLNIMEELALGIGDRISVYKANMIIPQISDNLTRSGNIEIPSTCPVCGERTQVVVDSSTSKGGTKTLICTNPDCTAKHVKRFSHFVSRDALNIEGLSESGLLKLIGIGAIRTLPDLFRLADFRDEIVAMEGFGAKSFDNLQASVAKASRTTPARLLYALGIPGIGVATSNMIARFAKNSWSRIQSLTEDELLMIDGIGEVMSRDYVDYFTNPENLAIIGELVPILDIDESFEEAGVALSGKVFVITGSLEHYANRKDLKAEIEAEGGKVAGSVSAKTDYLITNDPSSGSAKNKAARDFGVEIITEDQVIQMLKA